MQATAPPQTAVANHKVPRRWKRLPISVPLRVIVHRRESTVRVNGRGTELNEGGMCVFAGVEVRVGDQVEIEFTPPYASVPMRLWGLVRNRSGYYYGIEFLTENAGEREQVEQFREILRSSAGG